MPLQNRVDPFGRIMAVPQRGLFTGNRGIIHDPATRTLLKRGWTTRAWIICECDFRGRRREVMGRNAASGKAGWTELFFLDEVTALAAGHRPCFYCRRGQAADFLRRFGSANGIVEPRAPELDARLNRERQAAGAAAPIIDAAAVAKLPDGAMIAAGDVAFAMRGGSAMRWSFDGYGRPDELPVGAAVKLLTPPTTVAVLSAGYEPVWGRMAAAGDGR